MSDNKKEDLCKELKKSMDEMGINPHHEDDIVNSLISIESSIYDLKEHIRECSDQLNNINSTLDQGINVYVHNGRFDENFRVEPHS